MAAKPLSHQQANEAASAWIAAGFSRGKAATSLGIPETTLDSRLKRAKQYGFLECTTGDKIDEHIANKHKARLDLTAADGYVVIGSDAHYWPGVPSVAHKAFVKIIRDLKPSIVIMNGDVMDGAGVSRHPPIGWERVPQLVDEVDECKSRLLDIEEAAPKARKVWLLGNHDARFETRLAMVAPQYAKIHGIHLKDHFPRWENGWSAWINKDVVVKHRFKGGIHAARNNTLYAGKTIVTGHLHSLKVTPITDYNGTRFGVDTGCLAPIHPMVGEQFVNYLEDNPVDWRSGFAVLQFHKGMLLWPQVCHVIDAKRVEFMGKVFEP